MTISRAKSRLRHIAEDMFAVDDVRAIHTLIEYVEAYENADLIERSEVIKTANDKMAECYQNNNVVGAEAFNYMSVFTESEIPRFEPKKGSDE